MGGQGGDGGQPALSRFLRGFLRGYYKETKVLGGPGRSSEVPGSHEGARGGNPAVPSPSRSANSWQLLGLPMTSQDLLAAPRTLQDLLGPQFPR